MTIVLPLPPKELAPNFRSRSHWPRTNALSECRRYGRILALEALRGYRPPRWERALAQAVFYYPVNRRRDQDNLAATLKPYWDGIADAGIIVNDSVLDHAPVLVRVDKMNPRVELHVTEITS